jgi:hypothetical protein
VIGVERDPIGVRVGHPLPTGPRASPRSNFASRSAYNIPRALRLTLIENSYAIQLAMLCASRFN